MSDNMMDRKTDKEFRESGLLWYANIILHNVTNYLKENIDKLLMKAKE